jgi:hypothetical protein
MSREWRVVGLGKGRVELTDWLGKVGFHPTLALHSINRSGKSGQSSQSASFKTAPRA